MKKRDTSLSDSDISLQLSDASPLSSDSFSEEDEDHAHGRFPDMNDKKKKKKEEYCICRKGYDGKEFMIACDGCQEWFHGRCVDVKPKSIVGQYFCAACTAKKEQAEKKGRKGKG
ncbi:hypothetical protein BJV82DRAFT_175430 [Fennellomyces sp. T-0311]|nr:hypothetical protein BJV82DRAFT_175430 [Fennellomyces sp. T-0311]